MYIDNGDWSNDVDAFRNNWYNIIPYYDLFTWSKTNCCRKPQHCIGCVCSNIYDYVWPWNAKCYKQGFILNKIC